MACFWISTNNNKDLFSFHKWWSPIISDYLLHSVNYCHVCRSELHWNMYQIIGMVTFTVTLPSILIMSAFCLIVRTYNKHVSPWLTLSQIFPIHSVHTSYNLNSLFYFAVFKSLNLVERLSIEYLSSILLFKGYSLHMNQTIDYVSIRALLQAL